MTRKNKRKAAAVLVAIITVAIVSLLISAIVTDAKELTDSTSNRNEVCALMRV